MHLWLIVIPHVQFPQLEMALTSQFRTLNALKLCGWFQFSSACQIPLWWNPRISMSKKKNLCRWSPVAQPSQGPALPVGATPSALLSSAGYPRRAQHVKPTSSQGHTRATPGHQASQTQVCLGYRLVSNRFWCLLKNKVIESNRTLKW